MGSSSVNKGRLALGIAGVLLAIVAAAVDMIDYGEEKNFGVKCKSWCGWRSVTTKCSGSSEKSVRYSKLDSDDPIIDIGKTWMAFLIIGIIIGCISFAGFISTFSRHS